MNREEFLKMSALMGVGALLAPSLLSCKEDIDVVFEGKVLIVGAGSAGLMAGYVLQRYGIDFQIVEASSVYGGRVKKNTTLADVPLDMGAEWIHTNPKVFARLIDDESAQGEIEVIKYKPEDAWSWDGSELSFDFFASMFYSEHKFKRTTWYDFFEDFIVPSITSKIVYNSPVASIDYTQTKVKVTDINNNEYEGDKVIVTVPTPVLQEGNIAFSPALPENKLTALGNMYTPAGIKASIKFSEKFYPDYVSTSNSEHSGISEKDYFDGVFRKGNNDHIMHLFSIGQAAQEFVDLGNDQAIIEAILTELDQIFNGKASQTYVDHVIQNWSAEPYILGSYTHWNSGEGSGIRAMQEPVNNKLYFAGEAYSNEMTNTVHGAGFSGTEVAKNILQGE